MCIRDSLYDAYQPFMFPPGTTVNGRIGQTRAQFETARREQKDEADAAVRALGPRAIPLILAWMGEDQRSLRVKLRRLGLANSQRYGWLLKSHWVSADRPGLADEAANLIPV